MGEKYFEIDIDEKKTIVKKLQEFAEKISNFKPIFEKIDVLLNEALLDNFLTEGKSLGQKWQEWSEKYKKWRIKHYGGGQILTREGNLRESFVSDYDENRLTIGTAKEYAAIHNFGGKIEYKRQIRKSKKGKNFVVNAYSTDMPKREYFAFSDQTMKDVLQEIEDYANELIEEVKSDK